MTDDLTVAAVATALGASEITIRRWLKSGKLRGYRAGGTKLGWRIPLSEVERLKREGANDGHRE